jgi:hypothetical protein
MPVPWRLSTWRYDVATCHAPRSANLRQPAILRYASWRLPFRYRSVVRLPPDRGPHNRPRDRRDHSGEMNRGNEGTRGLVWVRFVDFAARQSFPVYPSSGREPTCWIWSVWATNRLMHPQQKTAHSIKSSARTSSVGGTMMPSAFAVFKLMISSNLVGCSIGRSAGFAPLNILSMKRAHRRY